MTFRIAIGKDVIIRNYKFKILMLVVCIWPTYLLLFCGDHQFELPQATQSNSVVAKPKIILWWTPFFHTHQLLKQLLEDSGPISLSTHCPYNCHFTGDRNFLNVSDAVLFHGRAWIADIPGPDFDFQLLRDVPKLRDPSQFWIFYLWESPLYTFWPQDAFNGFFNATMTYRRDSDIFAPVGRLIEGPAKGTPEVIDFTTKTKLIAWMVSYCVSNNKRQDVVNELNKFIPVDVYGGCGNFKCSSDEGISDKREIKRFNNPCFPEIGRKYKFYLAFENAHCKDYVTEKLFNALAVGMVPIVYGDADYEFYAPNGSFINVKDFESIGKLAEYILFLDKNPREYEKYFEWRKQLKVDPVSFHARAFCSLCEKLTKGSLEPRPAISNFREWWWGGNDSLCKKI